VQVKAHLPVAESFGFVAALRQQTSGQAFPQCVFDHWDNMPGNAMDKGGKMEELILSIRKRNNENNNQNIISFNHIFVFNVLC
jgi:elongation factor 2